MMESCLLPVAALVEQFRTAWEGGGGDALELEVRLGVHAGSRFTPGINPLCFKDAERSLDQCAFWAHVQGWREEVDVFLPNGVRQRVSEGVDGATRHSVAKTRLASETLLCTGPRASIGHDCGLDARVTLNREQPVRVHELVPCQPTHVRVKQRKTYDMAHWRWDLTRVWEGATRLDVERAQRTEAPRYEVELELLNADALLRAHSSAYIAESLLLKLGGLVRIIAKDPDLGYAPAP